MSEAFFVYGLVCDDDHDEVCFDSGKCPVCEKMKEIAKLEGTISDLEKELEAAQEARE